ncbi:hypothetical protein [Aquabacterium sp.]|uniref:hypothetical protein n=1 Tax=Aquabacterium sp. TaxID=1872578 RepID=UPI0025C27E28|nr:hypothetical protein [Aquabacterium sp.]
MPTEKGPHVLAEICLASDVPDPKVDGVRDGYAPHHRFSGVEYLVSGFHRYGDAQLRYPGDTWLARIAFPSWAFFGSEVKVGDRFDILEMSRLVGHGVVKEVL